MVFKDWASYVPYHSGEMAIFLVRGFGNASMYCRSRHPVILCVDGNYSSRTCVQYYHWLLESAVDRSPTDMNNAISSNLCSGLSTIFVDR